MHALYRGVERALRLCRCAAGCEAATNDWRWLTRRGWGFTPTLKAWSQGPGSLSIDLSPPPCMVKDPDRLSWPGEKQAAIQKSEIQNPKFETKPKSQFSNDQNKESESWRLFAVWRLTNIIRNHPAGFAKLKYALMGMSKDGFALLRQMKKCWVLRTAIVDASIVPITSDSVLKPAAAKLLAKTGPRYSVLTMSCLRNSAVCCFV